MTRISTQNATTCTCTIDLCILKANVANITAKHSKETAVSRIVPLQVTKHMSFTIKVNPSGPTSSIIVITITIDGHPRDR